MAKVTLVNPNRMKPAVAPLGLDYLAESLATAGHKVNVVDLCFSTDWRADVNSHFTEHSDLVGLTIRNTDDCYFASQDFFMPYITDVVATIRKHTTAPIVLGGAGLSVAPRAIMEMTGADYAVTGEGEFVLPLLASRLEKKEDVHTIPGLVWRRSRPPQPMINPPEWMDISSLPLRSRLWLDNRRYFVEGGQAGIETKRGCDRQCIYCADPVGKGRTCRVRPPSHILTEIFALLEQGIDCYHICDSEFNIPISHAKEICDAIIESGLGDRIRWYTYASPSPFNEELADLMQRAGCVGIDFGADSGSDAMLRTLGRDFTVEDLRRTADICIRRGIIFMYDLLIGGPGETFESVKQTIDLMKELNPSRVGVSVGVRIYNGTPLGEMVRREGISPSNRALHGRIEDNDSFLFPVYYISPEVGVEIIDYISRLIEDDSRFFHASMEQVDANYNYNENSVLVQAIRDGHRGAYWDILRRIHEGLGPGD